ncbi:MAG: response regulator transcription factor [Zoogloeaceae bacterium]|nr:response regulator transcription factor [Zoogloeaceae bacterium]
MKHLLVVEDDRDLAKNLVDFLEVYGYTTDLASDGLAAFSMVGENRYDLVVLDLSLPGLDGLSICRLIRQQLGNQIPIVVLTAKDEVDTKVTAFDIGADDYIVKPAALREIEARIRALLRRVSGATEGAVLTVGDLKVDTGSMRIERAGKVISLPPLPTRILIMLMRASPNVVHQQAIGREIWGEGAVQEGHALIVHMHTLRNAVDKPFDTQLIQTVRGFGYRIAHDEPSL